MDEAAPNCGWVEVPDDKHPTIAEDAVGFSEHSVGFGEVVEGVDNEDRIHGFVSEREVGRRAVDCVNARWDAGDHPARGVHYDSLSYIKIADPPPTPPADIQYARHLAISFSEGSLEGFGIGARHHEIVQGSNSVEEPHVTRTHTGHSSDRAMILIHPATHPRRMEVGLRGGPGGGPAVALDHERFAYAGKFRMTTTGKLLAYKNDAIVGAVAFNRDRTDEAVIWFRYLTVRDDHRRTGLGAELARVAVERLGSSGEVFRIAVNNPFAYEALYKAGFGYTGEETGIAELVLEYPSDRSPEAYRAGLRAFAGRDSLDQAEREFIESRGDSPPPVLERDRG